MWEAYDPMWLVELAEAQPGPSWLPEAFRRCTHALHESRAYIRFVPPDEWDFDRNLMLFDPHRGTVVVDVLTGERVGGIELLRFL
jgi:hypothetical protein